MFFQLCSAVKDLRGGNFGMVRLGNYTRKGVTQPCAIKSIKDVPGRSEQEMQLAMDSFLKEIKIMQILGEHPNVVKYLGAVTSDLEQCKTNIQKKLGLAIQKINLLFIF